MVREAHPIPEWLLDVLAFVNTVDVEEGTDELAGGPASVARWLSRQGLAPAGATMTAAQHRLALRLRAGLRASALHNNGEPADVHALTEGARALGSLPLVAGLADERPLLSRVDDPIVAALTAIAAGYASARVTGDWLRVRRCPAEDCAWVFWDSSAKGTRRWCKMSVCGNRAKVRAYALRQSTQD